MVRSLMLMIGLSLSVAAFGCSDDSGTGGTAGSGGAGGATGACTNTADVAIVCDAEFPDAVAACGTSNLGGGADAIAMCIAEDTGLSTDCADCFGATTACAIANCLTDCAAEPLGDACTQCRAENCDPEFDECTGEFSCG